MVLRSAITRHTIVSNGGDGGEVGVGGGGVGVGVGSGGVGGGGGACNNS